MKRLIISGLPCPNDVWARYIALPGEQRVVPFGEVLENTNSSDLRVLSKYVSSIIEGFSPTSLLCHDLGVPMAILALLKLGKKNRAPRTKITAFNGAFRKFDVFKAPHPFRVQYTSVDSIIAEVKDHGGEVDLGLKQQFGRIRALYRRIIAFSLAEKLFRLFHLESALDFRKGSTFPFEMQIIASTNDPYVPMDSVRQLRDDFGVKRFFELEYGHFPYTAPQEKILPLVEEFEKGA